MKLTLLTSLIFTGLTMVSAGGGGTIPNGQPCNKNSKTEYCQSGYCATVNSDQGKCAPPK